MTETGGTGGHPERERREEEDLRERARAQNEFFRHLTTLNVATAVVILALYRDGLVNPGVEPLAGRVYLVISLASFGLSLVAALGGMTRMTTILTPGGPESLSLAERLDRMHRTVVWVGASFFGGLATFFVTVVLGLRGAAPGAGGTDRTRGV